MHGWTRQSLPGTGVGAVLAVGLSAIATVLFPQAVAAALVVGILTSIAWKRPEVVLALFLTVGAFKRHALVGAVLPGDATIVLALLLLLGIISSLRHGLPQLPHAVILLLPIVLLTCLGAWGAGGDYATAKALRFGTLTVLGMAGCLAILRHVPQFTRFLLTIGTVAVVVTTLAALGQQTDSTARLRLDGTSPITLARMSVLTLSLCWLALRFGVHRIRYLFLVPIMMLALYVAVATGSRGPIASLVLGVILLQFMARRYHRRSLVSMGWVIGLGVAVLLLVVSGFVPSDPLARFADALTLHGDRSIDQRVMLYKSSMALLVEHPFGIGIGGFADHAYLNLRYPHNVFLETGVELGWVPMLSLLVIVVWSCMCLLGILRRTCGWTTCFMAMIAATSGINAVVSGDFNDNRMFFAFLLMPFLYRKASQERLEADAQGAAASAHAMHLASSR